MASKKLLKERSGSKLLSNSRMEGGSGFTYFCRMSTSDFEYLVIKFASSTQITNYQKPVVDRLAITWRFLATGHWGFVSKLDIPFQSFKAKYFNCDNYTTNVICFGIYQQQGGYQITSANNVINCKILLKR